MSDARAYRPEQFVCVSIMDQAQHRVLCALCSRFVWFDRQSVVVRVCCVYTLTQCGWVGVVSIVGGSMNRHKGVVPLYSFGTAVLLV